MKGFSRFGLWVWRCVPVATSKTTVQLSGRLYGFTVRVLERGLEGSERLRWLVVLDWLINHSYQTSLLLIRLQRFALPCRKRWEG